MISCVEQSSTPVTDR